MRKILGWIGGKRRMAAALTSIFPSHKTFVEPFAGGASVFWKKDPAPREVLADTNCDLIQFYDDVRKGKLRGCEVQCSRKMGRLMKKKRMTACEYFRLNKCSFANKANATGRFSFSGRKAERANGRAVLDNLDEYEKRLRRTHLSCADFDRVMKQFDGPDTLFYLDPPYIGTDYYKKKKNSQNLPRRIKKAMKRARGKVILSYNDCPEIRNLFCNDFRCNSIRVGHGTREWKEKRGTKAKRRELVIRNY